MAVSEQLGLYFTCTYIAIFIVLYLIYSTYIVRTSRNNSFCKSWFRLNWGLRSVSTVIIARVVDTATDLGAIIEFYRLSTTQTKEVKQINSVIDTKDLFIASLAVFIVSKLLCGGLIYILTRKVIDGILEIFDLLYFKMLFITYKLQSYQPSNFQRYIVLIETLYETAPQMLISMTFTLRTASFSINPIVFASFFVSLFTITKRITATESLKENAIRYIFHVILWRYFEISSRVLICCWLWVIIGAIATVSFLLFEFVVFILIPMYYTKTFIDSTVFFLPEIGKQNGYKSSIYWRIVLYRILSSLLLLIIITIFMFITYNDDSFWNVPKSTERRRDSIENTAGTVLFAYCWISTIIWPIAMVIWYFSYYEEGDDIYKLVQAKNWAEILELISFGAIPENKYKELLDLLNQHDDDDLAKEKIRQIIINRHHDKQEMTDILKERTATIDIAEETKIDETSEIILPLPGQCLIKITGSLKKDLQALKQRYGDKYEELMEREFVEIKSDDIDTDYDIESNSISVMQFNMMADGLCGAYSNEVTEKTFLNVDKECLQWTYRGIKLIEEILRFKPDVIGIEECDQLLFLMKYLLPNGYKSCYQIKTSSPIPKVAKNLSTERNKEIKMNLDGVALIYNAKKFTISGNIQEIDSDNKEKVFGLGVPLKINGNNNIDSEILFVVTHLKSTKTEKGEELRERQINLLLNELIENDNNLPVILCCDLNANPIQNKKGYDPLCYKSITNIDNLGYSSVYKLGNGEEPKYTTFKLRENGQDKHTIDYIFIKNGKWNVTKILNIPNQGMIPNWNYPSDHFSIMAQLTWK